MTVRALFSMGVNILNGIISFSHMLCQFCVASMHTYDVIMLWVVPGVYACASRNHCMLQT